MLGLDRRAARYTRTAAFTLLLLSPQFRSQSRDLQWHYLWCARDNLTQVPASFSEGCTDVAGPRV